MTELASAILAAVIHVATAINPGTGGDGVWPHPAALPAAGAPGSGSRPVPPMTLATISAVHHYAYTGECLEADWYPEPRAGEVTDYASIDRCCFPLTAELDESTLLSIFLEARGDD